MNKNHRLRIAWIWKVKKLRSSRGLYFSLMDDYLITGNSIDSSIGESVSVSKRNSSLEWIFVAKFTIINIPHYVGIFSILCDRIIVNIIIGNQNATNHGALCFRVVIVICVSRLNAYNNNLLINACPLHVTIINAFHHAFRQSFEFSSKLPPFPTPFFPSHPTHVSLSFSIVYPLNYYLLLLLFHALIYKTTDELKFEPAREKNWNWFCFEYWN